MSPSTSWMSVRLFADWPGKLNKFGTLFLSSWGMTFALHAKNKTLKTTDQYSSMMILRFRLFAAEKYAAFIRNRVLIFPGCLTRNCSIRWHQSSPKKSSKPTLPNRFWMLSLHFNWKTKSIRWKTRLFASHRQSGKASPTEACWRGNPESMLVFLFDQDARVRQVLYLILQFGTEQKNRHYQLEFRRSIYTRWCSNDIRCQCRGMKEGFHFWWGFSRTIVSARIAISGLLFHIGEEPDVDPRIKE